MKVCHVGRGLHGQAHCHDGCLTCEMMKQGGAMLEGQNSQVQGGKGNFHQFWLKQLIACLWSASPAA